MRANLDSILKKQRHYFINKGPSSQSYGFSSSHVWMWELDYKEIWVPKNDAFELWCWRRLLRVPWTARRSNQSILKEISPEYSLEGLMLKLKLQYFGHLMRRTDSGLEKTLMLGKIEGRRRRGWDGWMASLTRWTWVWASSRSWWWTGKPGVLQSMGLQRVKHDWATELNWTVCRRSQGWITLLPCFLPMSILSCFAAAFTRSLWPSTLRPTPTLVSVERPHICHICVLVQPHHPAPFLNLLQPDLFFEILLAALSSLPSFSASFVDNDTQMFWDPMRAGIMTPFFADILWQQKVPWYEEKNFLGNQYKSESVLHFPPLHT